MDTHTATPEPQHPYTPNPWASAATSPPASTSSPGNVGNVENQRADGCKDAVSASGSASSSTTPATVANGPASTQFPSHLEFLPFLLPQQSNVYHAQLLHYNKLISPSRGGGLQTPPLPPVVSAPHVQVTPRSRSSSRVSLKDSSSNKGLTAGGHGNRSHQNSDKNRPVITSKDAPPKMPAKQAGELPRNVPLRSSAISSPQGQAHSSSVPSTPRQHDRQFSFESREPSPGAGNSHSPRSAYSETNSTLPSLRPLPPRLGGCKYETAQINSRRRIPYSIGTDRLEKLDLRTIKAKLSENEERKLATDMREVYDRLLPTDEVDERRQKLVQKLEKIFNDEWPGRDIKVNLFGSSGNLLCSDDSDVDICITTPWRELEGVCIIADLLARRGMEKVVCISAAKVPIVKIWDPELGLACDMNVNNTPALENTRMVRIYVEADPRVRQLAMIIKYWTRRRIVNDAAFGGTCSSYTWICLIIAFLQLRSPPVLPALHQLPYKMPKPGGLPSEFADNLKKIRGFGKENKSSEAELLFEFFRFCAHEFDYEKHVLSVRQGKLVTKNEKKWHYAINNQLCVEEPFNTSRNLGNTVDEFSFRGLHLELRRAFDMISVANFEGACEQYVFPKEEEKVWSRPAPQPRPVLLRSSSQTHSGRGGRGNHRGGRHNNFHRGGGGGGGSSRRASSAMAAAYDPNMFIPPVNMQQDVAWYPGQQYSFQYVQQDLMTQMAYHQENMRQLHLYATSPAFLQHQQNMGQQRGSASSGTGQHSSDRSRTNSFDNPPVSAPLRPDLYALYGMTLGHAFWPQAGTGYGTYPSSPATVVGAGQDYRRPLQRTSATNETGASGSNSSMRSQSQPAARTQANGPQSASYAMANPTSASVPSFAARNANGIPIPSFMSDDVDFDETPKAASDSPRSDGSRNTDFFSAKRSSLGDAGQQASSLANSIAFGDLANHGSSPGLERLSTDQLPQTIRDRRARRGSRSPSPLGHARAFSTGTASAPLPANPFPANGSNSLPPRPLVVNGSGIQGGFAMAQRQPSRAESLASEDTVSTAPDTPLQSGSGQSSSRSGTPIFSPPLGSAPQMQGFSEYPPVLVNGSNDFMGPLPVADDASFRERIAMMNSSHTSPQGLMLDTPTQGTARLTPTARQGLMSRQPQNGVIAPLDLAIGDHRVEKTTTTDMAHLSPVYETRTPSPSALRKHDNLWVSEKPAAAQRDAALSRKEATKPGGKLEGKNQTPQEGAQKASKMSKLSTPQGSGQKASQARENGHVRSAKSESDGGWQKAGKNKKKTGVNATGRPGLGEQPPKQDSERKGG